MKSRIRTPSALISDILNAGIRAILISIAIEAVLLALAFGIGIGVWMAKGFLSGIAAGIFTLAVGQALAVLIIDMSLQLDERPRESTRERSDKEVLTELKEEVETIAEQGSDGDA